MHPTSTVALLKYALLILSCAHAVGAEQNCSCTPSPAAVVETSVAFEIFRWVAICVLVCFSALFSGLTLGLCSLDLMGLDIVINGSDDPEERSNARKIQAVRKDGNLLLCTLLLGNVAVNAALSILSAEVFDGLVGFFASTFVIVIFGEIVPQALCSRYALAIGARTVWIVQIFKYLLLIITWPISKILDRVLGKEALETHSHGEMQVLFKRYVEQGALKEDEAQMMSGALSYKDKFAKDVMTPVKNIFSLTMHDHLDFRTLSKIFKSGFSRIPVVGRDENHVVGMILTKDLIMIDPEEAHTVKAAMQLFGRNVHQVYPDMKLPDVLQEFKSGKGHLAVVMDVNNQGEGDPFYEVVGIVTLEDIIEEILQDEIVDETDVYVHIEQGDKVLRDSFDFARLRILDSNNTLSTVSPDEARAISAHLVANVAAFRGTKQDGSAISAADVQALLQKSQIMDLKESEWLADDNSVADDGQQPSARRKKPLYKRDKVATFFTLILSGKIEIYSGRDSVRAEYGAFQHLGEGCLHATEGTWKPDFSAFVTGDDCRCIRISSSTFQSMLAGSQGGEEAKQ